MVRDGSATATTESDTDGAYTVAGLRPALYTVRVESPNFAATKYTGMQLLPGQELSINLELKPAGRAARPSRWSAAASLVDTVRRGSAPTWIEREVKDLPINGRQMSQLYLQAPGHGEQRHGHVARHPLRAGAPCEQNVIRYDGIEGSAIIDAAPGNLNGENPSRFRLQASLENVQEFRVESSSYPAEYGTGTGGQVWVVSKSGTNQRARLRCSRTRAATTSTRRTILIHLTKSPLDQDQFGGSIGAPLVKDRTSSSGATRATG